MGIGRRKNRPNRLVVDWRDGGGVRHYREFPDSKEGRVAAEELWVRVRQQARTGKILPDERLTFGEFYEAWMQATRHGLANNTLQSREGIFATHLLPRFRKVPMVRVGRAAVRSLLADMLEQGYKPGTVSQVQLCVSALFSYAVDVGDLEANPVVGLIRSMKVGRGSEGREAMSRDQLGQFLAAAREGPFYHVHSLLAFSGVRISEARGLQVGDLAFVERQLHVHHQMHDTGEYARLKSRFSIRMIEVPSSLCALYRERASLPRKGPWLLVPEWGETVPSQVAQAWRKEVLWSMKKALRLAGLPETFSPHSLRHTCIRLHLEAGRDLLWVSRLAGHSSIKITADRYGRFARLRDDGAAEALAASVEGQALRSKITRIP